MCKVTTYKWENYHNYVYRNPGYIVQLSADDFYSQIFSYGAPLGPPQRLGPEA